MISIRPGREEDSGLLSDLALRSKGHWGYDAVFLEACREALTIAPGYLASHPLFVAESAGGIIGFCSLDDREPPETELDYLFVEPSAIGTGAGGRLWTQAVETARRLGYRTMLIEADPFAEPFYIAMGAIRVGTRPSTALPGRSLPLLRFDLTAATSR